MCRSKLLGKYDADVIDYVRKLREAGSVLNGKIIIAAARGKTSAYNGIRWAD